MLSGVSTDIGKVAVSVSIAFQPIERGEHVGLLLLKGIIGSQTNTLVCVCSLCDWNKSDEPLLPDFVQSCSKSDKNEG